MKYKGYTIEKETDPWCLKYNQNIAYYVGQKDDATNYAATVEEAKEQIDDRLYFLNRATADD